MKKIINIIIIVLIFAVLAITNNKIIKVENQTKNNEVLEVAAAQEVKKILSDNDIYIAEKGFGGIEEV